MTKRVPTTTTWGQPLVEGDEGHMKPTVLEKSSWDKGIISWRVDERSYEIQTGSGMLRRNRRVMNIHSVLTDDETSAQSVGLQQIATVLSDDETSAQSVGLQQIATVLSDDETSAQSVGLQQIATVLTDDETSAQSGTLRRQLLPVTQQCMNH